MGKILKEDCRTISIYKLREWDRLVDHNSGQITWTSGWSEKKSSVDYVINLLDADNMYFELNYTITDNQSGEKTKINHKYPLLTTKCNYGGKRYWFECSVFNRGVRCGRRTANLYLGAGSHYFACRHCYNLSYRSRIDAYSSCSSDIEEYEKKMKRWYYRGKPTLKHKRLLKMQDKEDQFDMHFIMRASKLLAKK